MLDILLALILTAAWGMHCGGMRMQGEAHDSHPSKRGGGLGRDEGGRKQVD